MAGLYFHIPFCRKACHYCDFHFSTSLDGRQELIHAMKLELGLQQSYLQGEPIDTIYFGGGTPSLLSEGELFELLQSIQARYKVSPSAEITLEANPDDLSRDKLNTFKKAGVNRLSIGIQTFDDEALKYLNRVHTAAEAIHSFNASRDAGFDNISIDLMFSLPGQSDESFKKTIRQALQLFPEHLSIYSLTIEPKTVFGKWSSTGKLKPVNEEIAAVKYETLMKLVTAAGYEHYEISNFARPGFQSRHNSSYWKQSKYLGIGPSAHSFNGKSRQFNLSNNPQYVRSVIGGTVPFEIEMLTRENKINEYIFTSLRTSWGCSLDTLMEQFQYDLEKENRKYISGLLDRGLVLIQNRILTLTPSGKLMADKIASDLFVSPPSES